VSTPRFRIELEFGGHGWIKVVLRHGAQQYQMFASYIWDFPGEMIEAANLLLQGAAEARVALAEEPGEWRWMVERSEDRLSLRVLYFHDWGLSDEVGEQVFATQMSRRAFARAVKRAIDDLVHPNGREVYEAEWGRKFPAGAYERLREHLRSAFDAGPKCQYACLCCGFLTLSQPPGGTYELCPVCYWEDDQIQASDPHYQGGANKPSLRQARLNFREFGACEEAALPFVRPPREHERP